ncbi:MAG: RluA family pseudouridine synthase [Phycisphaeraceae bacterium]|nr:MAG: RluA family pseudouridine synthase [Phycisphaeraceae bacterium]
MDSLLTHELRVLACTPRTVAVDKPAGLLSVPGKGPYMADCAAARIRAMFPGASGPLVVHRLDMETSGVMVFALDADAQRALSRQFESREVDKRYQALVRGAVEGEAGVIELHQRLDVERRPLQILDDEHGKAATTRWRVLERLNGAEIPGAGAVGAVTRIDFEPLTGRTHQLRLAAAAAKERGGLGAPIIGDTLYGPERERATGAGRLMLHATLLCVQNPDDGRPLRFESAAPF